MNFLGGLKEGKKSVGKKAGIVARLTANRTGFEFSAFET